MEGERQGEPLVASLTLEEERRALVVVTDDGQSFELAPDAPEARDLRPGLPLSASLLDALDRAAERKHIARRVFAWLGQRARCRADLRRRLVDRGFRAELADAVLDDFALQGLVDDRAYAVAWAQSQLRRKPVGRRWLVGRLRQEGVDADLAEAGVDEALGEHGEDEVTAVRRALRRRRLDLDEERDRRRAVRFLDSRGFSQDAILRALRAERADGGEDAES